MSTPLPSRPAAQNEKLNTCPICGSRKVEYTTLVSQGNIPKISRPNRELALMLCSFCGHACRIDATDLKANLELQANLFDENVTMPERRYSRWPHRPALLVSEIRRLTNNAGRTLDIGCNTGLWLATLGDSWEKFGVEVSRVAADTARRFAGAEVFCGPIESYHAQLASFDLITAFALIEHLSDPNMLVTWAYKHLSPGGLLVLMTGDRESTIAQQMGSDWPLYWPEEHVHFFSARSLCRLVEEAGFSVIRQEWRFMYTPAGLGSPIFNLLMKIKEIFRIGLTFPYYDHHYCYAQKVN